MQRLRIQLDREKIALSRMFMKSSQFNFVFSVAWYKLSAPLIKKVISKRRELNDFIQS